MKKQKLIVKKIAEQKAFRVFLKIKGVKLPTNIGQFVMGDDDIYTYHPEGSWPKGWTVFDLKLIYKKLRELNSKEL